jgi:hypothetical protein
LSEAATILKNPEDTMGSMALASKADFNSSSEAATILKNPEDTMGSIISANDG